MGLGGKYFPVAMAEEASLSTRLEQGSRMVNRRLGGETSQEGQRSATPRCCRSLFSGNWSLNGAQCAYSSLVQIIEAAAQPCIIFKVRISTRQHRLGISARSAI